MTTPTAAVPGDVGLPSERTATPEMIAAAWATWQSRHGGKLGPGPAFVEAINAALAVCPAFEAKEREIERMQEAAEYWPETSASWEARALSAEAKLALAEGKEG